MTTPTFSEVQQAGERVDPSLASQDMRRALAERYGRILTQQVDGPAQMRLWDCVDEAWTGSIPDYQAMQISLKRVVVRCSACTYTSSKAQSVDGGIKGHLNKVFDDGVRHMRAVLAPLPVQPGMPPGQICSACGATFVARKNGGQKHLDTVLALVLAHQGQVEQIRLFRYSLGPEQTRVLERVIVSQGTVAAKSATEPVASQVERSLGERKRNRHRGRNRRKRHGATTR